MEKRKKEKGQKERRKKEGGPRKEGVKEGQREGGMCISIKVRGAISRKSYNTRTNIEATTCNQTHHTVTLLHLRFSPNRLGALLSFWKRGSRIDVVCATTKGSSSPVFATVFRENERRRGRDWFSPSMLSSFVMRGLSPRGTRTWRSCKASGSPRGWKRWHWIHDQNKEDTILLCDCSRCWWKQEVVV